MPICIAGNHRSGTSMLAHMLHLCGLDLGSMDELIPATPDNPDGHWEHTGFVRLNDELLNQFGCGWDQPPLIAPDWQHDDRLRPIRSAAEKLVSRFPTEQRWGWKDPRNSLTLPFWKGLLPNLKVVVCVRNPLDVASSLHHRGLSSYGFGLALWQTYNERLLTDSSPDQRIVVHYNSLFTGLRGELQRIADFLELRADDGQFNLACATVKPNLRHHRFAIDDLVQANVASAIIDLYLRLCEEAGWSEFQEVQHSQHAPRNEARRDEDGFASAIPALVTVGVNDHGRPERSRHGTNGTEQRQTPSSLNSAVIEMTEWKHRQQGCRQDTSPAEPTPGQLKEHLAGLREQLEAVREQCRIRDERLAQQAQDLAELRSDWERDVHELQSALYELSAQQRLSQANGIDASRHIRYQQTVRRLREAVRKHVPRKAAVLVVSRGDEELLKLFDRRAAHFPQIEGGLYSGYYPKCSLSAVAHLETLRAQGAEYFIFPEPALWWLENYPDFHRHLERRYRCLLHDRETGVIYSLRERNCWLTLTQSVAECRILLRREPVMLNWNSGLNLAYLFPEASVFSPQDVSAPKLPYLDKTIDLVVVPAANPELIAEARRVATQAVLLLDKNFDCQAEWLSEASAELPLVSIVIPVHNQAATTAACLTSLLETLPDSFRGEIIAVDDASTDETPSLLQRWVARDARIRCVRNDMNQGFLESAQRGAAAAQGDILLFLNNDTILLPDWLPPLLRVFRDFPQAGAVGGKLLFADGVLQEAGGMVFRDASAAHFGRGDHDLDAPPYNVVREVDYCSGALLATRRALFQQIGGFDDRYRPAYYEDTDYCFAVRQQDFRVYYQPECAIVHLEGASSGTDLSCGVKQYQVLNQSKFAEKWSGALSRQSPRPSDSNRAAWLTLALCRTEQEGEPS